MRVLARFAPLLLISLFLITPLSSGQNEDDRSVSCKLLVLFSFGEVEGPLERNWDIAADVEIEGGDQELNDELSIDERFALRSRASFTRDWNIEPPEELVFAEYVDDPESRESAVNVNIDLSADLWSDDYTAIASFDQDRSFRLSCPVGDGTRNPRVRSLEQTWSPSPSSGDNNQEEATDDGLASNRATTQLLVISIPN